MSRERLESATESKQFSNSNPQSSEEASECQTVFRVGPNPSEDDNYVSFEIPSEQSGTSNAKTYYWTNSDDRVAFVTKYEQQVKVFQMRVII